MKPRKPKYYAPDSINFKNHWANGMEWLVDGSRGDIYTVKLTDKGFSCDCVGMQMHGKCKHTRKIAEPFFMTWNLSDFLVD